MAVTGVVSHDLRKNASGSCRAMSDPVPSLPGERPAGGAEARPGASAAPQPEQVTAPAGAGEAADAGAGGGSDGGGAGAGTTGAGDAGVASGAAGVASGPAGTVPDDAVTGTGPGMGVTPSRSGVPHFAQATQAASSMGARHFGQRPGTKGSTAPQNGQRATSRARSWPQAGQGCLKVGMVAPQLRSSAPGGRVGPVAGHPWHRRLRKRRRPGPPGWFARARRRRRRDRPCARR